MIIEFGKQGHIVKTVKQNKEQYFLSQLEMPKDVTKEILRRNSNKIMLCGGGGQHNLILNKI